MNRVSTTVLCRTREVFMHWIRTNLVVWMVLLMERTRRRWECDEYGTRWSSNRMHHPAAVRTSVRE